MDAKPYNVASLSSAYELFAEYVHLWTLSSPTAIVFSFLLSLCLVSTRPQARFHPVSAHHDFVSDFVSA